MFGVYCVVSGGVTGTRRAWLKDGDGNIAAFPSLSEADARAQELKQQMAGNTRASFHYSAMPLTD